MENNIVESDVNTIEIIEDDTNKINDTEKRTKENQTGKLVAHKNKKKSFYLGRLYCKTYSKFGNNKKTDNKQKAYVRQFCGSKVSRVKD